MSGFMNRGEGVKTKESGRRGSHVHCRNIPADTANDILLPVEKLVSLRIKFSVIDKVIVTLKERRRVY